MPTRLGDRIAERLLDEIVAGVHPPGAALPSEWELARSEGVSRLTVREAVHALRQRNVVSVVHGRGTFVLPRERWASLDPVVLAALARDPKAPGDPVASLLEAAALVEAGAAELAAARRSAADLAALEQAVAAMRGHGDSVDGFIRADTAFRDALAAATGNPVIAALLRPITALLQERRREASGDEQVRLRILAGHERVLAAVRGGGAQEATAVLRGHPTAHR